MEIPFNKKTLVRTQELLSNIAISQTTLSTHIREFKTKGRDLREMGLYQLKGSRYDLWNPTEYIHFLETEKLQVRPPNTKVKKNLDYDRIRKSLLVVNNNQERKAI